MSWFVASAPRGIGRAMARPGRADRGHRIDPASGPTDKEAG